MTTTKDTKDLKYYLSLPYTTVLKKDEEGDTVARIEELDDCVSHGADEAEAIANLRTMQAAWIEACIKSGRRVPEPESTEELPSGRFLQRLPRSLHQRLIRLAKKENVSLNTLVTTMLADGATAKLFGEAALEKLATSLVCHPEFQILAAAHHGHGESWYQRGQHWLMTDYVGTSGIVKQAHQVMKMVIPEDRTEEIDYHANEKEANAFGYARR
jgi:antitoxin HicB